MGKKTPSVMRPAPNMRRKPGARSTVAVGWTLSMRPPVRLRQGYEAPRRGSSRLLRKLPKVGPAAGCRRLSVRRAELHGFRAALAVAPDREPGLFARLAAFERGEHAVEVGDRR